MSLYMQQIFWWGEEQQQAFNSINVALIEATAFAQPAPEGKFVLYMDTSAVGISSILHQWQGPPENCKLRRMVFGSNKLTSTQAKYGAPKNETFAAFLFILKIILTCVRARFFEGGLPSSIMAEDLFNGPGYYWTLNIEPGKKSLLDRAQSYGSLAALTDTVFYSTDVCNPEDWILVTEECRHCSLLQSHQANVSSRTPYALSGQETQALEATPKHVEQKTYNNANTVQGIEALLLAQNCQVIHQQ